MLVEQLASGSEVANVGHAAANEHLVHLIAGDLTEETCIVGIIGCADHWLVDLSKINFYDGRVLRIGVGLKQVGVFDPGFHVAHATF